MNIRLIMLCLIMALCVIDLSLTYYYVAKYKQWQPNKPYKLIELNPLLRFSWEKFGLQFGMILASIVILALNFVIARDSHWAIAVLLLCVLTWALFNHAKNIGLLFQLIKKYPLGHLPIAVFGKVIGNN